MGGWDIAAKARLAVEPANRGSRPHLIYVGNFLSETSGTKPYCELLADRFEVLGWQVRRSSSRPGRAARLFDMARAVVRFDAAANIVLIDVFSTQAFFWAEVVSFFAAAKGLPIILILHGGNLPIRARKSPTRLRMLLKRAAAVVTPSRYLQAKLSSFRGDIRYIPNGLDIEAYQFRERHRPTPHLVWLRALGRTYRPDIAVRTLAALTPPFPEAMLALVGPDKGDGTAQLVEELARELGVEDRVRLVGSVQHEAVPTVLESGDVFLNTTTAESFGVSVMEAAACGLCIVTTDVGELPNLWKDGEDALLVPPSDPEAMAAAVKRILEEPGLPGKLSTNARCKAEQFDWSVVLPKWERLFCDVAK